MHASELPGSPDLTPPTIPVVCDSCRATGMAGDAAFAAIPDILAFAPVPRRAHANGWTPEHQRAFIAALAITGSAKQAARAIGRHQFGAEQLRTAKGGKAFAEAWDAAMDLAREREAMRIHANLAELAEQREAELARISPAHPELVEGALHPDCDYDPDVHADDYPEHWQAKRNVRHRLLNARRLYLMLISTDPARRAAWEVLVGPVDWDRAERCEPQDDEPVPNPGGERNPLGMPSMRKPDMILTVEAGLLPELTGGRDTIAELLEEVDRYRAADDSEQSPGDTQAIGETVAARPACPPGGTGLTSRSERQRCTAPRERTGGDASSGGLDPETDAMLRAIAAAREAHPEDFE